MLLGLVGVDGARIRNFRGDTSWADGLYHVFFRRSLVSDVMLTNVGDDAVSMASYESDPARADIETPFHGEGSVVSNVVLEGQYPSLGHNPSGGLAFLGVRDIVASNLSIGDRYRGIRFELGTSSGRGGNPDRVALNLSFLACRRVAVRGALLRGVVQGISVLKKETDLSAEPKWWRHEAVTLADITLDGRVAHPEASAPFDVAGIYGGAAVLCGFDMARITARNFSDPTTTLGPLKDCRLSDVAVEGRLAITGFLPAPSLHIPSAAPVPAGGTRIAFAAAGRKGGPGDPARQATGPAQLRAGMAVIADNLPAGTVVRSVAAGSAMLSAGPTRPLPGGTVFTFHAADFFEPGGPYPDCGDTRIRGLAARGVVVEGMRGGAFESLASNGAVDDGVVVRGCADLEFGIVTVRNVNRSRSSAPRDAFVIDRTSRRILVDRVEVDQDEVPMANGVAIDAKNLIRVRRSRVRHRGGDADRPMVHDRSEAEDGIGQIELHEWLAGGVSPPSRRIWHRRAALRTVPGEAAGGDTPRDRRVSTDRGDADVVLLAGRDEPIQVFATALTTDRTVALATAGARNGDSFRILRRPRSPHALHVLGLRVMPADTAAWAEVVFDGQGWILAGFGPL